MPIIINDGFENRSNKPLTKWYLNGVKPWADAAEANLNIPLTYRHRGLTVLIGQYEYWYGGGTTGIEDDKLVPRGSGGGGSGNVLHLTSADYGNIPTPDPKILYMVSESTDGTGIPGGFVIGNVVTNLAPPNASVVPCLPFCNESIYLALSGNLSALTWVMPSFNKANVGDVKMISASNYRVAAFTVSTGGDVNTFIEGAQPPALEVNDCYAYQCRIKQAGKIRWRRIA